MTATAYTTNTSIVTSILKAPLQAVLFIIRHPILFVFIVFLLIWGSISTLAHFNPAIAERFNNAATYFGLATITSTASDVASKAIDAAESKAKRSASRLATIESELASAERKSANLEMETRGHKAKIAQQTAIIDKQAGEIAGQRKLLATSGKELRLAQHELNDVHSRLSKFKQAGKQVESRLTRRFTKVALYDTGGEVLGWIPVLGDAASLGLAAGGIYEMCQMFKEIEQATSDLGVRYQVYTDTFCEKPAEKSAEIISETTKKAKDAIGDRINYTKIYWTNKYNEHFQFNE